jgi:ABC-2 type transport system permease protein
MDLQALYRTRAALFLKEIRPYLHYATQSASMAALIGFLLFAIGYRLFLQSVTPDFPWRLLCALVMLPVLAGGRIRTYLQEADTLFLLPQEQGMKSYLKAALSRASILQTAAAAAVWLIVWPLYYKLSGGGGWMFLLLLLAWLLYKQVTLHGRWKELQLRERRTRYGFSLIRWTFSFAAVYGVFALQPAAGILLLALLALAYLGLLSLPSRLPVNWQLLIELELQHKASIYRVLNWFVDVPSVQGKARNVRWLDRIARFAAFRPTGAYTYLYTLVWLRSELFGITVRLTIIGMLLTASLSGGLAAAGAYAAFALFSALQLADLKRYYHEHLWPHIYPVGIEQQKRSISRVRVRIHLAVLILLALPAFFTLSAPVWAGALLLVSAAASVLYHKYR